MHKDAPQKSLLIYCLFMISAFAFGNAEAKSLSQSQAAEKNSVINLSREQWRGALWADGSATELESVTHLGHDALKIPAQAYAFYQAETPQDFLLEMDMASDMMPGIGFRSDTGLNNYDYIYFRVYDAAEDREKIQYLPTFHGEMSWQLFNYPHFEKPAPLKSNEWFHLRLVVVGDRAAVYLNDETDPALLISPLRSASQARGLFLTSIVKAFFVKNLSLTPLAAEDDTAVSLAALPPEPIHPAEGALMEWQISDQFELDNSSFIFQKVSELAKQENFLPRRIKANEAGIVNLSRYFDYPRHWVIAQTEIKSDTDKTLTLEYDYTHEAAIFLNGQPIFLGKEIDRDNHNFGRVIAGEESIALNLKAGSNTLAFVVHADDELAKHYKAQRLGRLQARNWGFTARLVEN